MLRLLLLLQLLIATLGFTEPTLVFVHVGGSLPSYLETALFQARLFNPECPIFLVANQYPLSLVAARLQEKKIQTIFCEELIKTPEHEQFLRETRLDPHSQAGFWKYTSERFLYLNDLMAQYQLSDVFHLENDIMLYADLEELLPIFQDHYPGIAATFDNDNRCIPGFMYFSSPESMQRLAACFAEEAHHGQNDMQIVALFKNRMDRTVIDHLPIIPAEYAQNNPLVSNYGHSGNDGARYYNYSELFNGIFDAAALGQYIGGEFFNKRPGFVNESSIFNPSYFIYDWEEDAQGRKVPYAYYLDKKYKIFNLHIHSKQLDRFAS